MTRPAIAAGEQRILARQGMRSDGALNGIQSDPLDAAVVEEHRQAGPMAERVAHGLCQIGRTRHLIYMHSQPSSNATNCADDSAIRPVVLADGQVNCPRSSRLVSMHRPMPSCQISLISPARRPRKANTAPSNGSVARFCVSVAAAAHGGA